MRRKEARSGDGTIAGAIASRSPLSSRCKSASSPVSRLWIISSREALSISSSCRNDDGFAPAMEVMSGVASARRRMTRYLML